MVFFNLLGINWGDENKLTEYLLDLMKEAKKEGESGLDYYHVDFHGITKETDFSPVDEHVFNLTKNDGFNIFNQ